MVRIICEGVDDEIFIKLLLRSLKIKDNNYNFDKHLQNTNGKSHLLKTSTYDDNLLNQEIGKNVEKVLFIFDADFEEDNKKDGGLEKSKIAIESLIKELNWNVKTDYYIFDKNLDDFIIKTLDEKQQKCFYNFDECLDIEVKNKNKKISTCIYKKLYPQDPYDFSHSNFDTLKQKLTNLFNE
jgi:hypothetical protein